MKNKQIKLTEQDMHAIVEDAVISILRENGMEEGALWNAFKNKGAQIGQGMMNKAQQMGQSAMNKAQQFGQGAANMGRNMAATYQAGRQNEKLQKYAQNALNALDQLAQAAQQFNPGIVNTINVCKSSINKALTASFENLQNVSQNTFSTQRPNQGM